jgi:eukaryotic-like serine/threonine-protein kinase
MTDSFTRLNAALNGRYHVDSELGEGGMAVVYLADDLKHERKVALKVLKPELAAVVGADRFLAEIKTTANLQHPHILPLFDSGVADGFIFYVMPWVEGETLRERLDRDGPLPTNEAVSIASKVANALHAAHEHGVIHRDVKPANILLSKGEPLIADFGIALAAGAREGDRLTDTGMSIGTPAYMSPEQGLGDGRLDRRSDIYSLGCVLYEMLVGDPPFTGSNSMAVLVRKSTETPASVRAVRDTVPEALEFEVAKALAKTPADRHATAFVFAEQLVAGLSVARSHSPGKPRWPWRALGSGAFAAALLAGGWWATNGRIDPTVQIHRIAVLPLMNTSGDPDMNHWAVGMADEIWSELSQIGALRMAPPQSAAAFAGSVQRPSEIADELDVDAVLGGSVLRAGASVRVTLQLTSRSNEVVWRGTYDERGSDILVLTSQIARDVVERIQLSVSEDEERRLTDGSSVNEVAYELYLKGRDLVGAPSLQESQEAETLLRAALGIAPDFAKAHAYLAVVYGVRAQVLGGNRELADSAVLHADRALALDSAEAVGWLALAVGQQNQGRFSAALFSHSEAIRLSPSWVPPRQEAAALLVFLGRIDEAAEQTKALLDISPGAHMSVGTMGAALTMVGDRVTGERWVRAATAKMPNQPAIRAYGLLVLTSQDKWREANDAASAWVADQPASPFAYDLASRVAMGAGDFEAAEEWASLGESIYAEFRGFTGHSIRNAFGQALVALGRSDEATMPLELSISDGETLVSEGD